MVCLYDKCGKEFKALNPRKRYCNRVCRQDAYMSRVIERHKASIREELTDNDSNSTNQHTIQQIPVEHRGLSDNDAYLDEPAITYD